MINITNKKDWMIILPMITIIKKQWNIDKDYSNNTLYKLKYTYYTRKVVCS